MCCKRCKILCFTYLAVLPVLSTAPLAIANVNLMLQPVPQTCGSRYLEIELYAIADGSAPESIAAMDVILTWDPTLLQLRGISGDAGCPYGWLFSGFPGDVGLDGLNDTWADGDALYEALGQLGAPAYATPAGLLVTTFRFRTQRVGVPTEVAMPGSAGMYTVTAVYSGAVPGLVVTGRLEAASLTASPTGDMNCDTIVNAFDIDAFVLALTDPAEYTFQFPTCDHLRADTNCDGQVNAFDIDPFVMLLVED